MQQQINLAEFLKYVKDSEDIPVNILVEKMKKPSSTLRKSYTREFKLQTLKLLDTGRVEKAGKWVKMSKREVARSVGIAPNTLRDWEKAADKIMMAPKGSRRLYEANRAGRAAFWPEMEQELVKEFTIARGKGVSINRGWFLRHAKCIFRNLYPEEVVVIPGCCRFIYPLKFSSSWFSAFRSRHSISWRMKTNVAQVPSLNKVTTIQQYLRFVRRNSQLREGKLNSSCYKLNNHNLLLIGEQVLDIGRYRLGHIYNMDQTPLPFEFLRGRTYEFKGKKTVWVRSLRSSWVKRQATLMITACADGVLRIKPLIIFRGNDGSNSKCYQEEQIRYDKRVRVIFNSKAYSNEKVTLDWIHQDLLPAITADGNISDPRLLSLDVFAGQKTATVLQTLRENRIVAAFIPEGCTGLVQPMDTSINKVLKEKISCLLDEEAEKNPTLWDTGGDFGIADRRIVITKVVAEAWNWLHEEKKLLITRAFQYTGLALRPDGSSDFLLRIKDHPDLTIGDWTTPQTGNPTYGLDCNLGVQGKTGVGEIDYRNHDEELIDDDFTNAPNGDGEYVLQSETMDRDASAMTLDFLCN